MVYDSCYLIAGGAENLFFSRELMENTGILHWDLSLFGFFWSFFSNFFFLKGKKEEWVVMRCG